MSDPLRPRVVAEGRGRALFIGAAGALYVERGGVVLRSEDDGRTWTADCSLADAERRDPRNWFRIGRRLFRWHLQAMEILPSGARVVVGRTGLHRCDAGAVTLERVFPIRRGSRPLGLASNEAGSVVFGEYGRNPERREIHLYVSRDEGRTFEIGHTFPPGDVRHVHGVVHEPRSGGFWVLAGDTDAECGIGFLERDLATFRWVVRGAQTLRAVQVIRSGDALVYGTDSEIAENAIVRLDVRTGAIERLRSVDGSSLFGAAFGPAALISTCVEPSEVNRSRRSTLYASRDLSSWEPIAHADKDAWPSIFQFGTFVLAQSRSSRAIALVSGQALGGIDDRFQVLDLEPWASSR